MAEVYIVANYDGWLYDALEDVCVSPTGRLAPIPGKPFVGQLSASDHQLVIESIDDDGYAVWWPEDSEWEIYFENDGEEEEEDVTTEDAEDFAAVVEETVEPDEETLVEGVHARTWVIGDITVNIVDVV